MAGSGERPNSSSRRRAWAARREKLFGFRPDPDMPTYPFHPESRNTIVATCEVGQDGTIDAGFVPCWIDVDGRPEVVGDDARGRSVASYVTDITAAADLPPVAARWNDGRFEVRPAS